jgi:hypothetical protein
MPRWIASTDSPWWTRSRTRSISSFQIGISCSFDESNTGKNDTFWLSYGSAITSLPFG